MQVLHPESAVQGLMQRFGVQIHVLVLGESPSWGG